MMGFMTNNTTLTAETITTAQIRALRNEAQAAGDLAMVETCDIAMSKSPTRLHSIMGGNGQVIGIIEDCRATCADAINAGQG